MNDLEFHQIIEITLEKIENILENSTSSIDYYSTTNMLVISFSDSSQIIINSQPSLCQLWVACKNGGFQLSYNREKWSNDCREHSSGLGKILSVAFHSHSAELLDFSSLD
jgi:CyaY protein